MIYEIDGPQMYSFHEQVIDGSITRTYKTVAITGVKPEKLIRKMFESIDNIKKLLPDNGIILWRLRPSLKAIDDAEGFPTENFIIRCRLLTIPTLTEEAWEDKVEGYHKEGK